MTTSQNDILRVTARMQRGQDDVQNVYHVAYLNSPTTETDGTTDLQIINALDAAYLELQPVISQGVEFIDIVIQNLTEGSPARYQAWPTLATGSDTGTVLPYQTCGLVLFPTDRARRQGRKFIGGAVEDSNTTDGVPTSTYLTALAAYGAEIISVITLGGGVLRFGTVDENAENFAIQNAATIATYWATQRRRRSTVGS